MAYQDTWATIGMRDFMVAKNLRNVEFTKKKKHVYEG
jgi:hypothetical protein